MTIIYQNDEIQLYPTRIRGVKRVQGYRRLKGGKKEKDAVNKDDFDLDEFAYDELDGGDGDEFVNDKDQDPQDEEFEITPKQIDGMVLSQVNDSSDSGGGGKDLAVIIVSAVGSGAVAIVLVILLFCCRRRAKRGKSGSVTTASSGALYARDINTSVYERKRQPFDLTGSYRLCHSDNFEKYLEAQGVSWMIRSAVSSRMIPTFRHNGSLITIKIKKIPQLTLIVDGPSVLWKLQDVVFETTASYLPKKHRGVQVWLKAVGDDSPQQQFLCIRLGDDTSQKTWELTFQKSEIHDPIESVLTFERITSDDAT